MKAVKFFATLVGMAAGAGLMWGLVDASHPPAWALLLTLAVCAAVFYATHGIKRDLARIRCELGGHWAATFKKYDDTGYCPRCKEPIATRPPESDGPGMPGGADTLHQRVVRLEAALGIEEGAG